MEAVGLGGRAAGRQEQREQERQQEQGWPAAHAVAGAARRLVRLALEGAGGYRAGLQPSP